MKIVSSLFIAASMVLMAQGEDWPQWRGPSRNGISLEKGLPNQFPDEGPRTAWKANVGLGFSSLIVAKGKAYTAGHADGADTVYCFDAVNGKQIWKHGYPAELGDKYYEGGTTGTPTFDSDKVYWLSRWGDLFCFDAASGKILWQRQIAKETGFRIPSWGYTGAPTVHQNLLVLNVGERGMAVDKNTGKDVWKSGDGDAGYNTPLPVQRNGKTELWFANGESYFSIVPESGKQIWNIKWVTQYGVNAADPVPYGNKVFLSSGYGKGAGLFTLPTSPEGEAEQIWKNRVLRSQLASPILVGKNIFGVDGDTTEKAALKCVDAETGKELWAEKDFGSGGLIVADGKLIALSARGELLIAPVSAEGFKPTTRAQVLGGKSWTAPVLANGLLYCRNSRGDIVALDLQKK